MDEALTEKAYELIKRGCIYAYNYDNVRFAAEQCLEKKFYYVTVVVSMIEATRVFRDIQQWLSESKVFAEELKRCRRYATAPVFLLEFQNRSRIRLVTASYGRPGVRTHMLLATEKMLNTSADAVYDIYRHQIITWRDYSAESCYI